MMRPTLNESAKESPLEICDSLIGLLEEQDYPETAVAFLYGIRRIISDQSINKERLN